MPLIRVYSGPYKCPACGDEFRAKAVPDKELVCPECDEELVEITVEDESAETNEEEDPD